MAPQRVIRHSGNIRRSHQGLVLMLLIGSGTTVVEQNGQTASAFAGDVLLVFLDAPLRLVHQDARCIDDMRRTGSTETLTTISERSGYRDQTTFSRAFRRHHDHSPTLWLRPAQSGDLEPIHVDLPQVSQP